MSTDMIPDTLRVAEAELREEIEAQRLQDEARFPPPAGCCQYGCDGSGWRDLSEFETSPSSVEANASPGEDALFLDGRWLTPCECNIVSTHHNGVPRRWVRHYPAGYTQPTPEMYYAILNLAHPLGPTILTQNDRGAYGTGEIVEAWSDAVTAMHEYHNDSLVLVKLQGVTWVADEADHFKPCPGCGMYVPKNQPCCWCEA